MFVQINIYCKNCPYHKVTYKLVANVNAEVQHLTNTGTTL